MAHRTPTPVNLQVRAAGSEQPTVRVMTVGLERNASLVGCVIEGATRSISGQIAVTLTLETVLRCVQSEGAAEADPSQLLRESFREANQVVYDYAHRMRAGAAIGASLLLWSVSDHKMIVGRSGQGEAFLLRAGSVTRLFDGSEGGASEGVLERFIGANAKVLVDFATTSILEGDELLILNTYPRKLGGLVDQNDLVARIMCEAQPASDRLAAILSGAGILSGPGESHAGMIVVYGPQAIELRERVVAPEDGGSGGTGR